jgi:transcriptional/translational regulatory protein YebC/TACO1
MNIGFHISVKETPDNETNTCQIFVSGPMNQHFNNIDNNKYLNHRMYVHSSYISHLTSQHKIEEMKRTMEFNGIGIVVHYGIIELDVFRKQLKLVAEEMHKNQITCRMILEMKASKPDDNTHETVEKFNKLTDVLNEVDPSNKYFSICFDTSHFHVYALAHFESTVSL